MKIDTPRRTLRPDEKRALRKAIGHTSSVCEDWPCRTCEAMFEEAERLLTAEVENGLVMHLAYRPEVVAEVAVHLQSHDDWTELAKWCGGTLGGCQNQSGEWDSWITLPNGERGGEWSWLVLDHAGEFHFRTEVQAPEIESVRPDRGEPDGA